MRALRKHQKMISLTARIGNQFCIAVCSPINRIKKALQLIFAKPANCPCRRIKPASTKFCRFFSPEQSDASTEATFTLYYSMAKPPRLNMRNRSSSGATLGKTIKTNPNGPVMQDPKCLETASPPPYPLPRGFGARGAVVIMRRVRVSLVAIRSGMRRASGRFDQNLRGISDCMARTLRRAGLKMLR